MNVLLGVRHRERRGAPLRATASLAGPVSRLRVEETLGKANGRAAAAADYGGHRGCVNTIRFGSGSNCALLLSGGDDATLKIWDLAGLRPRNRGVCGGWSVCADIGSRCSSCASWHGCSACVVTACARVPLWYAGRRRCAAEPCRHRRR